MTDAAEREEQTPDAGRKPKKFVRINTGPEEKGKPRRGRKVRDVAASVEEARERLTPEQQEEIAALGRQISESIQARLMETLPLSDPFQDALAPLRARAEEAFKPIQDLGSQTFGLDIAALLGLPNLSGMGSFEASFARAARELSKIPPHVLRDAHVLREARTYLAEHYPLFLEAIAKPGAWNDYEPFEWTASSLLDNAADVEAAHADAVGPLDALADQVVAVWRDLFEEDVPTTAEIIEQDIWTVADTVVQEWRELYGMPLTEDVQDAADADNAPPVRSTDKLSQRLLEVTQAREDGEDGPSNGPGRGVSQGKKLYGYEPGYDLQLWYHGTQVEHLGGLHKLTADAIGSLWLGSGRDPSQRLGVTLTQITRQVMGTESSNTPTPQQEREVQRCIEDLMEITALVRNIVDYRGNAPEFNGMTLEGYRGKLAPADVAYLRTHKGNLVRGYMFLRLPLTFMLSQAYGQARDVAALVAHRKGGWRPSRVRQAVIQDYLATRVALFHKGSEFKPGMERKLSYEKIQEYVGGEYAPDVLTPDTLVTFRKDVNKVLKELQARGAIAGFRIYKDRQRYAGVTLTLPRERLTDLSQDPEEKRKLEARETWQLERP